MNLTTKLNRSTRNQPKYTLNVNIDIPLNSKYILNDSANPKSTKISPKKAYRLQFTPLRKSATNLPKAFPDNQEKSLESIINHSKATLCFKKQSQRLASSQKPTKRNQNRTRNQSMTMDALPNKKAKKKTFVIQSARYATNLAVEMDSENSVIRYTNHSNQSVFKMAEPIENLYLQEDLERTLNINVQEIREYQRLATTRKEHLNYLYLKQTVLANTSAKKIQRAWRSYKTKMLLKSHSHRDRAEMKLKKPLVNQQQQQYEEEIAKRMNFYNLDVTPNIAKLNQFAHQNVSPFEKDQHIIVYFDRTPCSQSVDFQPSQISQEIKKWDQLIKEIRQGKSLNDVLEQSYKRRAQLQREIFEYNIQKKQQDDSLIAQAEPEAVQNQRDKSIPDFEQKLKQIQQEIKKKQQQEKGLTAQKPQEELSQKDISQKAKQQQEGRQQQPTFRRQSVPFKEEQGRRQKPKIFQGLQQLRFRRNIDNQESFLEREMDVENRQSLKEIQQNQKQQKCTTVKAVHLKNVEEINVRPSASLESPKKEDSSQLLSTGAVAQGQTSKELPFRDEFLENQLRKLTIIERLDLCKNLINELVYECLLDFSDSEKIVNQVKPLFEKKARQEKSEGICTNLESIKDYLENLVSYILQQKLAQTMDSLNTPINLSPSALFQQIRKESLPIIRSELDDPMFANTILPLSLFEEHWAYVSEQIYFDPKYQNPERQRARIDHLKGLTNIYFRSIYDAFNESLQFQRVYGIIGRPHPWEKNSRFDKFPQIKVNAMKLSYQRIIGISVVYCGLHLDGKKQSMPPQVIQQVQEQRIKNLLYLQTLEDSPKWNLVGPVEAKILYQVTLLIEKQLLQEVVSVINNFQLN